MLQAALTGGIASGKSYCLERLAALGVPTIDADKLARLAVAPGSHGLAAVVARFGAVMLRDDGTLDRPALARVIFADRAARADLEAIVHPDVYRRIRDWFGQLPPATRFAVADIPLLFETGHEHDFDAVIVAACTAEEQLRRLMTRDRLSEADARARLEAQLPIAEKARRAHYVIRTDGNYAATDAEIERVYQRLRQGG
jgi:dephospho-CoA kinase